MSEVPRTQIRASLPPDLADAFAQAKAEAEEAAGVPMTNAQFLLGILRKEVERRLK